MAFETVYVTEMFSVKHLLPKKPSWRYAKAAHLWSASSSALEAFARQLKLSKGWRHGSHYDVTENKRRQALALGAVSVTNRELVRLMGFSKRSE